MRVLVSGAAGFLGSALVDRLFDKGHVVHALDDASRGRWDRLAKAPGNIVPFAGDVRCLSDVEAAVKDCDTIVHMAAINGTRHFYERPREVLDVGIRGTMNVIDACRRFDVKTLVLISSSEVYQTPPVIPTPEDVPLVVPDLFNPRYSYGGSKIASELMAVHSGIPRVVIVRPHNVYGPDMGWEHVIPEFAVRMLRAPKGRIPFATQGNGSQWRAFCHVDDFTDGLMRIIGSDASGVFNVGDPRGEIPMAALAQKMARILGRELLLSDGEDAAPGGTRRRCPDITKLRALGFEPKVSLEEGLRQTIAWYRKHLEEAP